MWRQLLIVCLFGALSCLSGASAASAKEEAGGQPSSQPQRPLALVIGNEAYRSDPLRNPVNDARAVSEMLRASGFAVIHHENDTGLQMKEAIREFSERLQNGSVGLFYFAGHGIQVGARTVLLPVDADSSVPASLLTKGIDVQLVHQGMSSPRPDKQNFVILDTCLNNPFGMEDAPVGSTAPPDTMVISATAPGTEASDGTAREGNGLFAAHLLKALSAPVPSDGDLFRNVAAAVRDASNGKQVPLIASSSYSHTNSFVRPMPPFLIYERSSSPQLADIASDEGARSRAILPKDSAEQYELAFWDSIKDSNHVSDYEAYLQAYPKGRFTALAKARIERLKAAEKADAKVEKPAPPAKPPAERPRPAPAQKALPERERPAPQEAKPKDAPAPAEQPAQGKLPPPTVGISELKDCPSCPTMIALPAGTFTMGSNSGDPSEKPAHRVTIGAPFAIGKYEVTVEQWNACVEAGSCSRITNGGERAPKSPVRDVSWDDAQQYVKWLSKSTGKAYRLPTEAEWEYAARGGTSTRFWWGERMRQGTANCKECGEPWDAADPANVGTFAANPFGLHDMNGSVWEWVSDCWHTSFKGAPTNGKTWDTPNCRERAIRGGSWRDGAAYMPSSTRFKYAATVRHSQNGFRVARDMQ
ncbi:hypothetical protein GCM10027343_07670 [Noviherbaspirillum agri]